MKLYLRGVSKDFIVRMNHYGFTKKKIQLLLRNQNFLYLHCFYFITLRTTRLPIGAKLYRKFAAWVQLIIIVLKWNKNLITLQVYSQVSLSLSPPLCLAARPQWGPQIQKRLRQTMHTHPDCLAMASGAEKVWVFSKNNPCVCICVHVCACLCVWTAHMPHWRQ